MCKVNDILTTTLGNVNATLLYVFSPATVCHVLDTYFIVFRSAFNPSLSSVGNSGSPVCWLRFVLGLPSS
ncbi:unnamed protein product [Schistosoma curassoni]|uniref:G_PROTEIN_RECEP_F1_2 domain-containing protein n=1 Tax=Schistosoma curassoni TaxID=6186 RepID=A0A183JTB2_9TREM|nr:unnamed protein product [Schistosoma curassoni]